MIDNKIKIACLGVLLIFAGMYLVGLDNNLMDYDEGAVYLYPQMLVHDGLRPYVDFIYTQPPALLYVAHDVLDARIFTLLIVFCTVGGVYAIGRKFGVGYYSAVFLISCPLVMHYGRLAVGDIPVMGFFTAVLLYAMGDLRSKTNMIIYGSFMAVCILIKIQMIIPLAFIFIPLIIRNSEHWHIIPISFAIMVFICVSIFMPNMLNDAILNNMGGYDLSRAVSYLAESIVQFGYFAVFVLGFALYGMYVSRGRLGERKFRILYSVVLSSLLVGVSYSWIAYRHFMYLLPVLAIFAGIGLKSLKKEDFALIIILCSLLVPISEWHKSMYYDNDTRMIVKDIENYTKPWDKIYTDQPMLAALSNKTMPNTALLWNGMGRLRGLGADDVINDINATQPSMILLVASTPESMDPPRIVSTFGNDGANKIINYLDSTYAIKEYSKRDYQMVRIWKK